MENIDGKSQRREEKRKMKRKRMRKLQKKEDPGAQKGRKVGKHCAFPSWRKQPAGQMRDEQLRPVVAQTMCPSQNVQGTPCSDHFGKLSG